MPAEAGVDVACVTSARTGAGLSELRAALLELGGFNEALYPNEENALMDELQKRGGKLLYDPDLAVARRPRSEHPVPNRVGAARTPRR